MSDGGNNGCSKAIKVISMGAPKTGKSCLIKRYCEKRFVSKYMATLGIDYGVTSVTIKGDKIKVNIFDMGGEQFFYEVRNEFYKGTNGAILVYDVTDRTSFENMSVWLSEMKSHAATDEPNNIIIVVCANKIDVSSSLRVINEIEGRIWAETRGYYYYETSASSNINVIEMFECLFSNIVLLLSGNKPVKLEHEYTNEQISIVEKVLNNKHDSISILGVKHNATREEIIKAYKHLAVLLHPDKNSVPGSEEAFKILCSAKDELLNYQ